MEIIAYLGSLLYVVSNYEKGHILNKSLWTRHYINSINESVEVMARIVSCLSNAYISRTELDSFSSFFNKRKGNMISVYYSLPIFDHVELRLTKDQKMLLTFMNNILHEITIELCFKKKNYKKNVSYLLKAFHNLPRCLMNEKVNQELEIPISPISYQEAFEYANSYLRVVNKCFNTIVS